MATPTISRSISSGGEAEPIRVQLPTLHPIQAEVRDHPARFKVLACGRRWGKTRLGSALCLDVALHRGAAWWVAPSYKVAAVGWRLLKRMAAQIPGGTIRESDKIIEFPNDGWVQVRSADDPDSLRGEGLDFVVMDECAFISEEAWTNSLRPALTDRKGRGMFISTPFGMNWFWRHWTYGQDADRTEWASWQLPSKSNPYLDPTEIDAARDLLPERVFAQEYEATFLEEAGGVFRKVREAVDTGRTDNEPAIPGMSYSLGVDLARVADFTVLDVLDRTGRQVYHERFNQISWERQIESIIRVAKAYSAFVYVDSTGVGDPIYEQLAKHVYVEPYHFSNQSKNALIDNLAILLENGRLRLLDVPTQTAELQAYQYELTAARNIRTNAPPGMNDDCVIALALAAWNASSAPAASGLLAPTERYYEEARDELADDY